MAILSTELAAGSLTTAIYIESDRYCRYSPLATLRNISKMIYIADMPSHSNLERIGSLASDQWGLITRRQAEQSGLSPATVARLSMTGGLLKRVTHGVYLVAGAPVPEDLALRAAWLQLAPEVPVWERTAKDGVVSHRSAASLYRVGDLSADRHEFTLPERRQTRRRDVRLHTRPISKSEWIALRGLRVTRPARIASDLLYDKEDPEAVSRIVADSLRGIFDYAGAFADSLA
ncbi:MAG: type IV toxin-antitoxin system AbiEi family antitoxin domain-containing protein, partial [Candidatus Dormiibacterota bacterium]